jgi:hypothetical protein
MENKPKDLQKSGYVVHSIHLPSIKTPAKNQILLVDAVPASPLRKPNPIMNKSFQNRQSNDPIS